MEKQVKVVVSKKEPQNKHVLWLEHDSLHEISPKLYNNGEWQNLKTVNVPEELLNKVGELNDSVKEFDKEVENFSSDITSFRNSLITETQQRMAVDSSLGNRITSVTVTANNNTTSLNTLETKLNTNLVNLKAKDTELETAINNEAKTRRNEVDSLQTSISNVGKRVSTTESKIITLQGNVSTLQSEVTNVKNDVVPKAVAEGIAQVVANAPEDLDTLKEVADYIASDKTKAAEIETAISDLQKVDKEIMDNLDTLVVNDLTTGGADKALSAEMGKELKEDLLALTHTDVGNFYQNAWVRYSDGYISPSSGGAKLYIIKRSEIPTATKIIANVCTESTDFAGIAFYSSETPSVGSYIKEFSVQGIRSAELKEYVAQIPESCQSIVVLNMSQLQANYSIKVDTPPFANKEELQQLSDSMSSLINEVSSLDNRVVDLENILAYTDAGNFYQNAWVRYSDGFISHSSGGAKIYIIKRSDIPSATKVIASVCTENKQFAAIAFYSSETPSVSSYIKESSVQGITSNESREYTAQIPESCQSIIVLNMSQLQSEYSIKVDLSSFANKEELDNIENEIKQILNTVNIGEQSVKLFNPFNKKGCYHHLNQETYGASTGQKHTWVPAQSLYDIAYAKFLGFDMIETNVHACSDGVLITKHGNGEAFGLGLKSDDGVDYKDIKINTIDSQYIREHITYDSVLEKYNSPIPTLEEFAAACKQHGLSLKTDYKSGALEIVRKHLTDDAIFFTGLTNRGNFRGLLEIVWNRHDMVSFDSRCKALGAPLQIIIQAGLFDSLTDEEVVELTTYAHTNGYTVAVAYVTTNGWLRAKSLGIDTNISTNRTINSFEVGNDVNINSLQSDKLEFNGCVYDSEKFVINMPADSTLIVPSSKNFKFGKCAIDICYKGKITIIMGQNYPGYNLHEYSSNGNETISIANAIQSVGYDYTRWCTIKAVEDTTVKSVNVRGSFTPV